MTELGTIAEGDAYRDGLAVGSGNTTQRQQHQPGWTLPSSEYDAWMRGYGDGRNQRDNNGVESRSGQDRRRHERRATRNTKGGAR